MNVTIISQPILLYETLELVFGYWNRIPPEKLVGEGEYCVPQADAVRWMEQCCGALNRDDPELNWFFRAHDLDDSGCGTTCVARALLYAFMDLHRSDWDAHMEMLVQKWQELRQHRFAVTGINAYTPELEDEGIPGRTSIASAFSQLQTDPAFTLDLVEAFSDYAGHLRRLDRILRPVSRALLPELEAAAAQAKPLYDAWSHFFHVGSPDEFVRQRCSTALDRAPTSIVLAPRLLDAGNAPGQFTREGALWFHMGVGLPVGLQSASTHSKSAAVAVIRLLGDQTRLDMLRLMSQNPMCPQELVETLGTNPGTISRNLSSFHNVNLVIRTRVGSRYLYRTDQEVLKRSLSQVSAYLLTEQPDRT